MKSNMHRHILQSLSKAVIAAGLSVAISLVAAEESTDITEPTPPAFDPSIAPLTHSVFQPVETADAPESDLTPEDSEDESIAPVSTEAQPNNPTITEPAAITDEEVAGANRRITQITGLSPRLTPKTALPISLLTPRPSPLSPRKQKNTHRHLSPANRMTCRCALSMKTWM